MSIRDILAGQGGGAVKSVQRGLGSFSSGFQQSISIAPVDPSKSFILIEGYPQPGTGGVIVTMYLTSFSSTSFMVQRTASNGISSFSWQVVEFY